MRLKFCRPMVLVICCLVVVQLSRAPFLISQLEHPHAPVGQRVICSGIVQSEPVHVASGMRVDVRLQQCAETLGGAEKTTRDVVRLTIAGGRAPDLIPGQGVRFLSKFKSPRDFHNPGAFPYRLLLFSRGVALTGFVADADEMTLQDPSPSHLARLSHHLRSQIRSAIARHGTPDARGLLAALAIADRQELDPNVRNAFAITGIAHVLALSGLHVGMVAGLAMVLMSLLLLPAHRLLLYASRWQWSALLAMPLVWAYVWLAGCPISAVRAALMFSALGLALWVRRRHDALDALLIAIAFIVLLSPLAIFDISFQLSALSVLGIVVITPRVLQWLWPVASTRSLSWKQRCFHHVVQLFSASAAAIIATAPLVAWYFQQVAPLGLIFNLLVIPWMAVVLMPLVVAAMFFPTVWSVAGLAALPLQSSARLLADRAGDAVLIWSPTVLEMGVATAGIWLVCCASPRWFRRSGWVLLLIAMLAPVWRAHLQPLLQPRLSLTMLDVGQGDALIVRFPRGTTWLVDGGGLRGSNFDIGRAVLVPALRHLGISRVDALVVTHPHVDHYRGFENVLRELRPLALYENGALPEGQRELADWEDFLDRAWRHGLWRERISAESEPLMVDEVEVRFLHPPAQTARKMKLNDGSLVMQLRYGSQRILLTGDVERVGEQMLLEHPELTQVDVLKVAHHGSKTSSAPELLQQLAPRAALVSVGAGNSYRLPSAVVMDRLKGFGAKVYRSDTHGATTVALDGAGGITVTTILPDSPTK